MKKCYHCDKLGLDVKFTTIGNWKIHLAQEHGVHPRGPRRPKQVGIPNVVHYGARMRRKLGLTYDKAGHLRSTLEIAA